MKKIFLQGFTYVAPSVLEEMQRNEFKPRSMVRRLRLSQRPRVMGVGPGASGASHQAPAMGFDTINPVMESMETGEGEKI